MDIWCNGQNIETAVSITTVTDAVTEQLLMSP